MVETSPLRPVLFLVVCAVVTAPVVAATSGLLPPSTGHDAVGVDDAMTAATLDVASNHASGADSLHASDTGPLQQVSAETEPNDGFGRATSVESGVPITGSVGSLTDVDVFSITADSATTLTVDLGRGAESGTLGVAVFDAQGNFLGGQFVSPSGQASFDAEASQPGQYFVVVASGSQFTSQPGFEGTGSYTLRVTAAGTQSEPVTETEPNDVGGGANPIDAGVPVRGEVSSTDDLDFYAVDVLSAGTLRIRLQQPVGGGTLAVGVFDPRTNFLTGRFASEAGQVEIVTQVSQPGRYLVLVASGSQFTTSDGSPGPDGTGPYTLDVSVDSGGPPTTPGGETATPTPGGGFATPTPGSGFATPTPGSGFATPTTEGSVTTTSGGFATPTTEEGATTPSTATATPSTATATPSTPGRATEFEPNDVPGQANLLAFGGSVAGAVASSDDVDWYAFDATAGETFNATLARTDGTGTFRVIYYYPNGTVYADFQAIVPDGRGLLFATPPTSGRYYVRVASPDGSGAYTLSVRSLAGAGQGIEGPEGGVDVAANETVTPEATTAGNATTAVTTIDEEPPGETPTETTVEGTP